MLNDFYQNELKKLDKNNEMTDLFLSNENERRRRKNDINLMEQEIEQDEIEDFWINDNKIKREKMKEKRKLLEYNLQLENEIQKKENNHYLELKQIEDEQNLNLQNLQNTHLSNLINLEMNSKRIDIENINKIKRLKNVFNQRNYNYQIEKKNIENKYKTIINNEEIKNKKEINEMNNNIELMKRNSELEILKINQNLELEEKKINNENEINKLEIKYRYIDKLRQEDLKKEEILRRQNLEKEKMEMKLELMMRQILLNKINSSNN